MRLREGKEVVLVIPDLQTPFQHKDALDFLDHLAQKHQPTRVVCIGDSMDHCAISEYASDPDGYSPGHEYELALRAMEKLYTLFPEGTEVYSNHNARVYRKAFSAGLPKAFMKSYRELQGAPDTWDFVENIVIDSIKYEHGDRFGSQYACKKAMQSNRQSTVIGHHHTTGGILYEANEHEMLFGMNVGCLIDQDAYAFAYTKKNQQQATLSAGIVNKGVPILEPMLLGRRGRWIRR